MLTRPGATGAGGLPEPSARTPSEQLRMLLRLSEALASTTTVEGVADTIGVLAQQFLGAAFGGVAVVRGEQMHYLSLRQLPESMQEQRRSFALSSDRPAAVVTRERRVMLISSIDTDGAQLAPDTIEAVRRVRGRALAFLPMFVGERVVGAISLMWSEDRRFSPADRQLLMALARYTAQAFDRARLLAERREVAHTMQAALLPTLPRVDWLSIYAEYRPAHATEAVGGDWYDAFGVGAAADGDDSLVVTVGDVTGHDVGAASEMAWLQASLRALALDRPDEPHELLRRLDRLMAASDSRRFATAVVASLTPGPDGLVAMSWSNAGHPPPLLLEPGRAAQWLERPAEPLLGLSTGSARSSDRVVLAPGSTVVLVTDGLIEKRGVDLDDALRTTAQLAQMHRELSLVDFVDTVMSTATGGMREDDTVVLAVRTPSG